MAQSPVHANTNHDEDQDVLIGEEPGASDHPMLATEDSYEELDYDLNVDAPVQQTRRERLASGTIASIVEEHIGSVEELATEATELENNVEDLEEDLEEEVEALHITDDTTQHGREDGASNRDETPTNSTEEDARRREAILRDTTEEDIHSSTWRDHKKHVFILSEAGKPIYSRYGNEDKLVSLMGVMSALISFVQDGKNSLRSIVSADRTFVFLVRQPLILVAVSRTHESQQQLLMQLTYVYNQVLSVLTFSQLSRVLETRKNYDLRRLLSGTEKFLDNLLNLIDQDPSFLLTAVRCLPLDNTIRDIIGHSMQSAKIKDLVFAILIADNQLVTLCRMKKYVLHPADLHLVFNLLNASTSFQTADSWIPICLPKFDSTGFLHAHISYLDNSKACLLLLTVDKMMFFELAQCKEKILEKLKKHNCLEAITKAIADGGYRCREVGISDLRHFIYKSKSTAQFTAPDLEAPYKDSDERARLFSMYQYVHQRVHNAARPLKIMFHVGSREALLGWVTTGFELYAVFGPLATKQVAILAVNKLLKWIKKEEDRLFILNPPEY
ncbi:protein SAND-like [Asterias rubens]|uniref:protein SAND-like n=1 Tax=Asterias rubens TaxID=7604 RepID=UPI0014559ED8|nr:protein SAND-like [Asterias rubens]